MPFFETFSTVKKESLFAADIMELHLGRPALKFPVLAIELGFTPDFVPVLAFDLFYDVEAPFI